MERLALNFWNLIDRTGKFIVTKLLEIFKIEISDHQWKSFMQFVKFGLVGVSNTIISYIIYVTSLYIGLDILIANFLGFMVSVFNSFYWNNKFVFKTQKGQQRSIVKSLLKTYMSYALTGICLNSILLIILVNYFGISEYIAPIIIIFITIPINFILNKLWAFKNI